MDNGEAIQTDTGGDKPDKSVEDNKEDISELDKLKAHNDAYEKEIIRGRELKAEGLKQEAEKMVGGKADAGQTKEEPEKLSNEEYASKFMKGEVNPMKEDDISIN